MDGRSVEMVVTGTVPGVPAAVRAWYCDIANLQGFHPIIVDVRRVGRDLGADGTTVTDFVVRERVLVGPLPVRSSYRVRITAPVDGPIGTRALQFPGVRLDGTVTFTADDAGTAIREQVTIRAPRLLLGFVAREARRAHEQMLARMAVRFATDPPTAG